MTTPIDELAGRLDRPRLAVAVAAARGRSYVDMLDTMQAEKIAVVYETASAEPGAARSTPVPASNVSEHRPSARFEDGSPPVCIVDDETWPCSASNVSDGLRPRTEAGRELLRRNPDLAPLHIVSRIEDEAAALAHAAPKGLDALDRADNLARVAGRYLAGDSDIQPEDVRAAIDDYWLHRRLSQPDATEEAGR